MAQTLLNEPLFLAVRAGGGPGGCNAALSCSAGGGGWSAVAQPPELEPLLAQTLLNEPLFLTARTGGSSSLTFSLCFASIELSSSCMAPCMALPTPFVAARRARNNKRGVIQGLFSLLISKLAACRTCNCSSVSHEAAPMKKLRRPSVLRGTVSLPPTTVVRCSTRSPAVGSCVPGEA